MAQTPTNPPNSYESVQNNQKKVTLDDLNEDS